MRPVADRALRLDLNQFDVFARRFEQRTKVVRVRRENLVTVSRQQRDGSVDDAGRPRALEQRAYTAAKSVIEWNDLDRG